MRIHSIENINVGLKYIASKGVKLVGISSEDVVDENRKLILGMVWTIILRFAIADISEEELNAKEALLLWCKKKTAGYRDVAVENFTYSWQDGLALCALIHAHRPDLIPYDTLDKENKAENLRLAFEVAEKNFDIPQLLDVEDIVDVPKPDERSVMTYIAQFYHYFSANRKNEIAGRRIGKLVDITKTNDELKADYNAKAAEHVAWVKKTTEELGERDFDNTLEGIKKLLADFANFKTEVKPPKVADRLGLESLHSTIQAKLSSSGRPPFQPDAGLTVDDIAQNWSELEKAQQLREDALLAELARQELLDLLAQRFNNKAKQLEDWIAKQSEYLNTNDDVDTLLAAEQRLKQLEAFRQEYEENKERLKELHGIKDDYVKNDGKDKQAIIDRADRIQKAFDELNDLANKKNSGLDDALRKQREMEELRKKFANAAKEYNYWVKDTNGTVAGTVFPDSLEAIEQYKAENDAEDESIRSTNNSKKAVLDDLWNQEQQLGIKENPYTVFTDKDIGNWHQSVEDSLAERQKAYQAELERQKRNEEKRKEFAAAADEFVKSLDQRRSDIDNLQGEPRELIQSIKDTYADGKPEQEKLAALTNLQEELSKLGIVDNRHTKYTLPLLKVKNDELARHVRTRLTALEQEDTLKKEYNEKAKAFNQWIDETLPTIGGEFDNTLEGALQVKSKWTNYKTTDRTLKGLEKINLEGLFNTIQSAQEANNRPAFTPDAGNSPQEISAKWDKMNESERNWENAINEELERQEKLHLLVKHFNAEADVLDSWTQSKQDDLNKPSDINTLDAARIQLMTLDVHDEEYQQSLRRLENVKTRASEIESLNYHKNNEVQDRVKDLVSKWDALKSLSSSKRDAINGERDVQQKKENLRLDFADKAKNYVNFVRDARVQLDDYNFGTTLEDVTNHRSALDESDKSFTATSDEKKSAVEQAAAQLTENGISDNKHTQLGLGDINNAHGELQQAVAARRAAYDEELKRQQDNDADRKQFADRANEFVEYLNGIRSASKAVEGTPDEKTQKVKDIFQEGAPAQAKLQDLVSLHEANRSKGIYSNPYTPHTIHGLQTRLQQLVDSVNNLLAFFAEETEFQKREVENEKEFNAKQELEQKRLDFEFDCKKLQIFLDSIQDVLTDPINVSSVAAVNELIAEFEEVAKKLEGKRPDYDSIVANAKSLSDAGVPVTHETTTAKWNEANANADARRNQLNAALSTQQENEQTAKAFADKANATNDWVQKTTNSLHGSSGDLEAQLDAIRALNLDEGKQLLEELSKLAEALAQAGVRSNPFTELNVPTLNARVGELASSKAAKETLLEKEILSQKHSKTSPEQIEEFKEVFKHFDKNGSGSLSKSEFKSCLQSLGEDLTDSSLETLYSSLADVDFKANGEDIKQIGFLKFLEYMVKITSDSTTQDEISSAFRDLAKDKDYITADDLRSSGMPTEKVDYLLKEMPTYAGVEGGLDYNKWAASAFNR